jgi:hypothetical protein
MQVGAHVLSFAKEASGLGADQKPFNFPPGIPFLYHSIKDCGWRAYLLILAYIEMISNLEFSSHTSSSQRSHRFKFNRLHTSSFYHSIWYRLDR